MTNGYRAGGITRHGARAVLARGGACLALWLLAGCKQSDLIHVRLAHVRVGSSTVRTTTDPQEKNRMLRAGAHRYLGMSAGLLLAPENIPNLVTVTAQGFTVWSMDEGIALSRPGVYDYAPAALLSGGRFHLYWCSGQGGDHIFRASSSDGTIWTEPEQILAPSARGAGAAARDSVHNSDPALLRIDGTYYLYYTGTDNGTVNNAIFLATSGDGLKWRKHAAPGAPDFAVPVIANDTMDDTYGLGHSSVLYKDGVVHHYYTDRRRGRGGLWLALSEDGIHFHGHRQVAPDIENADVKYCPALRTFFMVYGEVNDAAIYFALSPDGVTWPPHDPARVIAAGPPETVHHSPGILADEWGHMRPETRVFYSGGMAAAGASDPDSWEIESTWIRLRRGS